MSMFDYDNCRKCGAPVAHAADYCDDYPNCGNTQSKRKQDIPNPPMSGHWE